MIIANQKELQDALYHRSGQDYFKYLIKGLIKLLNVEYAFLAQKTQASSYDALLLAFGDKKRFYENFVFDIRTSPKSKDTKSKIQSYMAIPLNDEEENYLGILGIMDSRRWNDAEEKFNILLSLSQRTSSELNHFRKEQHLKYFFDLATSLMITYDQNGIIQNIGPSITALLGYKEKEILKKKLEDFVHPDDIVFFKSLLTSFAKNRVPDEFELRLYTKKKNYRWFSWRGIYSSTEDLVYISGADISRRKKAEIKLQKNQALLAQAQKMANLGHWELDLIENKLQWSDETFRIFEMDPKKFKASYQAFLKTIHPKDRELVDTAYRDSLITKTPYTIIHRLKMKDGRIKYVKESCETSFDEAGNPLRSIGTVLDITELKNTEEALRMNEEKFRHTLESMDDMVFTLDEKGVFIDFNQSGHEDRTLVPPSVFLQKHYNDILPSELSRPLKKLIKEIKKDGISRQMEYAMNVSDKEEWYQAKISNLKDAQGEYGGNIIVVRNITEQKKSRELLAAERRRLRDILKGTNVGTWEWNVQSGETIFNERWANMLGYTLEELQPTSIETWKKYTQKDDFELSNHLLEQHFKGKTDYYECEVRMLHKDGSWVWILDRGKVASWTKDKKPLLMSGTHQDITERKKTEEKIRHMATHDTLTDLPSVSLAKDRIQMAVNQSERQKNIAAIMFVDLDSFKKINDTYGHDAGDAILLETAQRLLQGVRKTDTVARIGGDEFLVVLTDLKSKKDAEAFAVKMVANLSKPFYVNKNSENLGASIGIALYPDQGKDPENLIKQADSAMYNVKRTGKNGYAFSESPA